MDEVRSYAEDGKIHMTCEFCRADYEFTLDELAPLAEQNRTEPEIEIKAITEKGETS